MGEYRYGFNGKENDNEVKGEGNQQDYGFRIYDPRIGKFLSVDPLTPKYPGLTPYQFASNRVIDGVDLDGLEYVKRFPNFEYTGEWYDYISAIDNGAINVINIVPDFWNSAVFTYQSIRGGTYGQDLKKDFQDVGNGVKSLGTQLWNNPLGTLTSPQALEFGTSIYLAGKLPIITKNVASTVANSSTKVAELAFNNFGRAIEIREAASKIDFVRNIFGIKTTRNIALLEGEIEGIKINQIGVSGPEEVQGIAPIPKSRVFKTIEAKGYERMLDSEVKVLENFVNGHPDRSIRGSLTLTSERAFCESCSGVVEQFKEMYPNVQVSVVNGIGKK
ncbi:deaminase domain-containing protein [Chitinophaga agri]|uniref:RHS repeat-associated core domain-containing protein n=1 Tax=Chitinophaga agri TaxID=2703787 RepID=A0A6B9ZBT2_9BACT|nr:deaminase domain-containing protein [Chitinophaga agri]QHS58053.1 hypothetical protein GWR21_00135 [Chitinophaga agri]